jgi:putative ATP-dependent endonuclease of OLD family
MYVSELQLSNFRQFGSGPTTIPFHSGVTALVGSNDSGKSAVIDALRYVLSTRDQEYLRVQPDDFNLAPAGGDQASLIVLRCKFSELRTQDLGSFAEYLTFEDGVPHLYLHWSARRTGEVATGRRWVNVTLASGPDGSGPSVDSNARQLLAAAYLRPLRDAEREMSSGKGSRLSQVLSMFPAINVGKPFNPTAPPASSADVEALGLSGLSEYLRHLVNLHSGVTGAQKSINEEFLGELSLAGDDIRADINFVAGRDEATRLRQILERLELNLHNGPSGAPLGNYGLGSNNLLFMACELLLLSKEQDGLPLLLIEEPEAHLHPQRQLQLMRFLQGATATDGEKSPVQVILTTHSPNLASKIPLANVVLMKHNRGYSLRPGSTALAPSDYRFLERFLDVTKANLFFARGVLVVEGDSEELLLPTIASLLGKDLTKAGVSIVNVRGTGLRRYTQIFQRRSTEEDTLGIKVAAITDLDVMPDAAPAILGLVSGPDDAKWSDSARRWKALRDYTEETLEERRNNIARGDGQGVKTFVADQWTFEYALAAAGLARLVHRAAFYAQHDDQIVTEKRTKEDVKTLADTVYAQLVADSGGDQELIAIGVYQLFRTGNASKAIAAQYLAEILEGSSSDPRISAVLRKNLPTYIVEAIDYVTSVADDE